MAEVTQHTLLDRKGPLETWYIECRVTTADLTDGDGSQVITFPDVPDNSYPFGARGMIEANVTGGTISAATMAIGTAASPAGFMSSNNVFDGTVGTWFDGYLTQMGGFGCTAKQSTADVVIRVNTTDGNVDTATTGALRAGYYYQVFNEDLS